jgi:hypothetical protein
MPRRSTRNITGIKGAGDVDATLVYRVIECGNSKCRAIFKVSEEAEGCGEAPARCPTCDHENPAHSVLEGSRWKYCRVCGSLKPLEAFHRHKPTGRSFRSGRQLECKICKNTRINPTLNPLRTPDQHREAADMRRLYGAAAGGRKVDTKGTFKKFGGRCFKCGRALKESPKGPDGYRLDHTLPARLLWPLSLGPTLLCQECNANKAEKWPAEFYSEKQLRELAVKTGVPYDILRGNPQVNPAAVDRIRGDIDNFLVQWIRYPVEIKRLRQMILQHAGVDIFQGASTVPAFLLNGSSEPEAAQ